MLRSCGVKLVFSAMPRAPNRLWLPPGRRRVRERFDTMPQAFFWPSSVSTESSGSGGNIEQFKTVNGHGESPERFVGQRLRWCVTVVHYSIHLQKIA